MVTSTPCPTRRGPAIYIAPACALGVLIVSLFLGLHPEAHGPGCMVRAMTGMPCPGCGMTRSLSNIWRGHFWLSFRYHPIGIPFFLVCIGSIVLLAADSLFPRIRPTSARIRKWCLEAATMSSIAVLLFTVWIVRVLMAHYGSHLFLW